MHFRKLTKFTAWLYLKKKQVVLNKKFSTKNTVNAGVPQGFSILGYTCHKTQWDDLNKEK